MNLAVAQPLQQATSPLLNVDKDQLTFDFRLSVTLGVTESQAKRKLTRFFMDEVSLLIHPDDPLLVLVDAETIYWRFPVILSLGKQGRLGQIGEVDVDAQSGELQLNEERLEEMTHNARILARSATLSTDA